MRPRWLGLLVGVAVVSAGGAARSMTGVVQSAATAPPASIVLLIDVTRSVSEAMVSFVWDGSGRIDGINPSGTKAPDSPRDLFLRPVEQGFIDRLAPTDRVRIGRIAQASTLGPSFSSDRRELDRALGDALAATDRDRYGASPIWDAVDAATSALAREAGLRHVLVVTDGMATGDRLGFDEVVRHARAARVSISVLCETSGAVRSPRGLVIADSTRAVWTRMTAPFGPPPRYKMKELADATGGAFVLDGEGHVPDPARALRVIVDRLHDASR